MSWNMSGDMPAEPAKPRVGAGPGCGWVLAVGLECWWRGKVVRGGAECGWQAHWQHACWLQGSSSSVAEGVAHTCPALHSPALPPPPPPCCRGSSTATHHLRCRCLHTQRPWRRRRRQPTLTATLCVASPPTTTTTHARRARTWGECRHECARMGHPAVAKCVLSIRASPRRTCTCLLHSSATGSRLCSALLPLHAPCSSSPSRSNFLTDKPSSRVLAPPGGGSSIVFG